MKPIFVCLLLILIAACARKDDGLSALTSPYGEHPERTAYEIQCINGPPPPGPSGNVGPTGGPLKWEDVPVPEHLPKMTTPIEVQACDGLDKAPHFYSHEMPGLIAVVDCNARVVRFRTRDWQVSDAGGLGPFGDFDVKLMYILRMVSDGHGNDNCWARLLGHITGKVDCPSPTQAKVYFTAAWTFDETPPEVMEPSPPGNADSRNGKHCKVGPGNCHFSNNAAIGCGG